MEVLISPLVLGPIPIFSLSEAFLTHNSSNLSLSFGVGVGFNATTLVLDVNFCFCSMAWHVIKSIVKLFEVLFSNKSFGSLVTFLALLPLWQLG